MGEAALQVKKAYADLGYCLPQGWNELPDYVGIELDFLRYLCGEEAGAWKTGKKSRALVCLNKEKEFLCGHVLEWVPKFCDEVLASAKEDFYRGMAQVTKAFVAIEAERLRSLAV